MADNMSLTDLEAAQGAANQALYEQAQALEAANSKVAEAQAAYEQAVQDSYFEPDPEVAQQKLEEANQALMEAQAEAQAAEEQLYECAAAVEEADKAVEAEIEALRESRYDDTTYVVHTARVECSCAARQSYLALDQTHGVYTRGIPQMIIGDTVENTNIITFGRCKSKENPKVVEAAEQAALAAREQIQNSDDWRDKIMNFFFKPDKIEVTDSLIEQCEGECIMELAGNVTWRKWQGNVRINGRAPLMRKCELTCKYGGQIVILLSGQPE